MDIYEIEGQAKNTVFISQTIDLKKIVEFPEIRAMFTKKKA